MLVDLFSVWWLEANRLILMLFDYIFPEYPKIGIAVFVAALLFLVYYLVRGKAIAAVKISFSTLVTLSFLLYVVHCLIKIFKV
ncbi:hypothetical protein ABTM13_19035, partial [Acinetobacter baumannii]